MQAFPYTKLHCSTWNVDQAGALLFCSAARADELGIAPDKRVYPLASTESNHMAQISTRADLAACPGAEIAGCAALDVAGLVPHQPATNPRSSDGVTNAAFRGGLVTFAAPTVR